MKKTVVPTLLQEVKVKVDIVTSDDIKIYYTGKLQDFTARYIIKTLYRITQFQTYQNQIHKRIKLYTLYQTKKC